MKIYLNTQEAYMCLRLLLAKEPHATYMDVMQHVFDWSILGRKFLFEVSSTGDCIYLMYGTPEVYYVLYKTYIDNNNRKDLAYFIKKAKEHYKAKKLFITF